MIIIVGIMLSFTWLFKRPCVDSGKSGNIPSSAIWKGGCDGGVWMELVDIKADTIRFRIYQDWNGELLLDANFVSENCTDLLLTSTNWSEYIDYFDGTKIYSKVQVGNGYCRLVPVFPTYYEEKQK